MPRTNSWLCIYSIAQLGKPYWYATSGQISTAALYSSCVTPNGYSYSNYKSQLGVKVHDCSGLIVGALTCETVDSEPSSSSPVAHGATSQFNGNCSTKSNSMKNFPYIPGTLVFHTNGSYKSHVGIYVGTYIDLNGEEHNDTVVEAMGHDYGVTTTKITHAKWDSWGQLACCTIDTTKDSKFDARVNATSAGVSNMDPLSIIEVRNMKPFVATILSTYQGNIDYKKIREARISAMMFFAGELFDASHDKKTYKNPKLPKLVNDCDSAGMPYALYVNVRARTEIEADEECRTLYYILAQYPPTLGIWLSLQLGNNIGINNSILELYYRYFEKWGIKARCGLYVTPQQLSKITWGRFSDRFYLWQIDPMDVNEVDDELLQPDMFEVPD